MIGLAMLATAVPAFATTADDLAKQVADLEATLAALMAAYGELAGEEAPPANGVAIPAACVGISFDRNLSQGASGNDVKCLQAILNLDSATQVAATGVGSAGNETTHFGPLTKAAVINFQAKYATEILTPLGLTAGTGFVGNSTRVFLNAMLAGGNGFVPPAPVTDLQKILQQLSVLADTVSILADRVARLEGVAGDEGTLTVALYAVPGDTTVKRGTTDNSVYGVQLTAAGSDVDIQRATLQFNVRPWLFVDHISLYDGNTKVAGVDATAGAFEEVTVGSVYKLHFTGLDVNVPKGTNKVLTVKVNVPTATVGTGNFTVLLPANGIRGVDDAGLQLYGDSGASAARTVTLSSATTAELEVGLHADSPSEGAAIISASSNTEVELFKANLTAKDSGISVSNITFAAAGTYANGIATVFPALKLYDGETLLQTVAGSTAPDFALSTNPVYIEAGTTKVLTVKADVSPIKTDYTTAGDYLGITLTGVEANITAEDDNYNTLEDTEISGTATGNNVHFYLKAPELALVSQSITTTTPADNKYGANAEIKMSVTALGGDIYIRKYDSTTNANSGFAATKINSGIGDDLAFSIDSTATPTTNGWVIYSGQTRTFTIAGYIPPGGTAGMNGMYLSKVRWNTTGLDASWINWDWASIQVIFRTGQKYISA